MKVRCVYNTGEALRAYEYVEMEKTRLGRFGATGYTEYGELDIGKEYLVMGIIIFETCQAYLIDSSGGLISACPCQLFEVIDSSLPPNWHFRLIDKTEEIYPFVQAIFGYYELCYDRRAYEKLIVDKNYETQVTYFKRKMELERTLEL